MFSHNFKNHFFSRLWVCDLFIHETMLCVITCLFDAALPYHCSFLFSINWVSLIKFFKGYNRDTLGFFVGGHFDNYNQRA